ncbi:hypothetical protein AAG602_07990 [Citromicrobium bathyomarinum]
MSRRPLPSQEQKSVVRIIGLAPLARAYASQPRDPLSYHYPTWAKRLRVAELEVIRNLRAKGVTIEQLEEGAVRITFAGIRTTSRLGLRKALKNWSEKAEGRRVDGFYRAAGQGQKT